MKINCYWAGGSAVLTAGSALSRSARKRGSGRACCSCNTGCTSHSRSTPCTSNASPWCHASCSCHRWCWSGAHLEEQVRWLKKSEVINSTCLRFLFSNSEELVDSCIVRRCYYVSLTCKSHVMSYLSQRLISWDAGELRHKQHDKNTPTPLAPHLLLCSSFAPLIEGQASEAEKWRFKWSKMLMSPAWMCVSFKSKIELDGWRWEIDYTVSSLLKISFVKAKLSTIMTNTYER